MIWLCGAAATAIQFCALPLKIIRQFSDVQFVSSLFIFSSSTYFVFDSSTIWFRIRWRCAVRCASCSCDFGIALNEWAIYSLLISSDQHEVCCWIFSFCDWSETARSVATVMWFFHLSDRVHYVASKKAKQYFFRTKRKHQPHPRSEWANCSRYDIDEMHWISTVSTAIFWCEWQRVRQVIKPRCFASTVRYTISSSGHCSYGFWMYNFVLKWHQHEVNSVNTGRNNSNNPSFTHSLERQTNIIQTHNKQISIEVFL